MSESRFVIGIAPPDEQWRKMKHVWDACRTAGVELPRDVVRFFGDEEPDDAGVILYLDDSAREWVDPDPNACSDGIEIDVKDIPKHVKTIRFMVSY